MIFTDVARFIAGFSIIGGIVMVAMSFFDVFTHGSLSEEQTRNAANAALNVGVALVVSGAIIGIITDISKSLAKIASSVAEKDS